MLGLKKLDAYESAQRVQVIKEVVNGFFIGLLSGVFLFNILYFFYTIFASMLKGETIVFEDAYKYYELPHILIIAVVLMGLGYFINKVLDYMGFKELTIKTSVAVYELVVFLYPIIVYVTYIINSDL